MSGSTRGTFIVLANSNLVSAKGDPGPRKSLPCISTNTRIVSDTHGICNPTTRTIHTLTRVNGELFVNHSFRTSTEKPTSVSNVGKGGHGGYALPSGSPKTNLAHAACMRSFYSILATPQNSHLVPHVRPRHRTGILFEIRVTVSVGITPKINLDFSYSDMDLDLPSLLNALYPNVDPYPYSPLRVLSFRAYTGPSAVVRHAFRPILICVHPILRLHIDFVYLYLIPDLFLGRSEVPNERPAQARSVLSIRKLEQRCE
ncbi:unnamed protein product [Cyclocybe aegerita]|uniref:Uncharacterized protein n=1 Tax=Cyclocybe aegerita TaxID=1973307 RepID=A0A8S0XSZ3_CYCAE|nr:unnamed protein product [Cyclocybe aegerita]